MGLGRTALYYKAHPAHNRIRLAQQKRYDDGNGSTGRSKQSIRKYHSNLAKWKKNNAGSKPSGIAEAVHGANGSIRWASGEKARKHNRGNEVRKRNKPSNPKGGARRRISLAA